MKRKRENNPNWWKVEWSTPDKPTNFFNIHINNNTSNKKIKEIVYDNLRFEWLQNNVVSFIIYLDYDLSKEIQYDKVIEYCAEYKHSKVDRSCIYELALITQFPCKAIKLLNDTFINTHYSNIRWANIGSCEGCAFEWCGQKGHMGPGGCLENKEFNI